MGREARVNRLRRVLARLRDGGIYANHNDVNPFRVKFRQSFDAQVWSGVGASRQGEAVVQDQSPPQAATAEGGGTPSRS